MKKIWPGAIFALLSSHAFAGPPVQVVGGPDGGAKPVHYISATSNNSTLVAAGPRTVYSVTATNSSSTIYYLKLYDKATAPTCNSDTPVQTYAVPHNTAAGSGLTLNFAPGMAFQLGFTFCLVSGIADNNNGSAAVNTVAINFGYN